MTAAIEVHKIVKTFNGYPALRNIDFEIAPGETVAIIGHNGAGKTTLIKLLATILNPDSGSMVMNGHDPKTEPEVVRRQIGLIGHQTYLYNDLTARENLEFYARLYDVRNIALRIKEVGELVSMTNRLDHKVGTLSRGMQQRISIARSLLHNPQIMLLDEAETGLDQAAQGNLWTILGQEPKRTTVFATHNLQHCLSVADRIIILSRGRIAFDKPASGLDEPGLFQAYKNAEAA